MDAPDREVRIAPPGDRRAAFTRLFTASFTPVYRYAQRQVPTEDAAREIVYRAFSRLWVRGTALDFNRPLLSVLLTLARLAVIDYWRREPAGSRPDRPRVPMAELDGPPPALNDAEREFVRRELVDFTVEALDALSLQQREVAVLRWREQLSPAEVARRLRLPPEAVEAHLARARESLREALPELYGFD